MNVPLALALASFATGATFLQFCARLPPAPGASCLLALTAAAATFIIAARRGRQASPAAPRPSTTPRAFDQILWAAIAVSTSALLGFSYAAWRAESRLADALPPTLEERDLHIRGVVDDLPQNSGAASRFAFAVEQVVTPGAVVPHRISLAWFAPRAAPDGDPLPPPRVHPGERWDLAVRLKRPHGTVNPDGFDLEAWLLEHELRATGYVRDDASNRRVDAFAGRPGDYVQRSRERVRDRVGAALPGAPYAGVLMALAIGDQRAIAEPQWAVFNKTGITHLVSISGLHVTVFAALAAACAHAMARRSAALTLRVPARKVAALTGVVVAFGYVLLAGAEVPAVRTLWMLGVAAAGLWLGRPGTAAMVWLWSLVAVVAGDPWAGLAPGFWLSFGAVGLLLYAGSGRLSPRAPQRSPGRLRESIVASARAQWVVTVGLVPGTLALFQQVSVVSAFSNAIAIPVVTLVVVPLALLGIVVPIDAPWTVAHAILSQLMRYLEWLAALPMAAWTSHAPRGWTVAAAVAGIVWLVAPKGVPGRGLGALWTLPMAMLLPPAVSPGGVRLVVLDVGQGLAVFAATAHHALVYDTGPKFGEGVDAGARIVAPFLRAAGVSRLDVLVVSHADSDHSGGAMSLLQSVPVRSLISSLPHDHPIVSAAPRTVRSSRCAAGERWTWDGVDFEIVHPASSAYENAERKTNDLSCVLRITSSHGSALLTGDIEALSEGEILARGTPVGSAVLVVPHHGSRTSSTSEFIRAVDPRFAIITAGYRNRFGHPRGEIVARYARTGARLARTDLEGAMTIETAPGGRFGIVAERDRHRRYWYDVPAR